MDERLTALPVAPFLLVPVADGARIIESASGGFILREVRAHDGVAYPEVFGGGDQRAQRAAALADLLQSAFSDLMDNGLVIGFEARGRRPAPASTETQIALAEDVDRLTLHPGPAPAVAEDRALLVETRDRGWDVVYAQRNEWYAGGQPLDPSDVLRWCWLP